MVDLGNETADNPGSRSRHRHFKPRQRCLQLIMSILLLILMSLVNFARVTNLRPLRFEGQGLRCGWGGSGGGGGGGSESRKYLTEANI